MHCTTTELGSLAGGLKLPTIGQSLKRGENLKKLAVLLVFVAWGCGKDPGKGADDDGKYLFSAKPASATANSVYGLWAAAYYDREQSMSVGIRLLLTSRNELVWAVQCEKLPKIINVAVGSLVVVDSRTINVEKSTTRTSTKDGVSCEAAMSSGPLFYKIDNLVMEITDSNGKNKLLFSKISDRV